jgi:hypothetical protein
LNPTTCKYDFNEDLEAVQTPQLFRNLSACNSDRLDHQSNSSFFNIMPRKDFYDAVSTVGTNNWMSRRILGKVGFYPHVTVMEDSALSVA